MTKEEPVSFKRPPVVETVLGVQFDRFPKLTNSDLAAFWKTLGPDWPDIDYVPELEQQFERFDDLASWTGAKLVLSQTTTLRLRIKNATGDRMIQVQNGRFHYNWLGHGGEDYPRYRKVRPEFDEALAGLQAFLEERNLGTLQPNQWEVTYVNHMKKGTVWNQPRDWGALLRPLLAPSVASETIKLEGLAGHWRFEITPQWGRLHVELEHGRIGSAEGEEALVMKLTARGPVATDKAPGPSIDEGLNLGHRVIVTTFRDLTSSQAHEYWGEIT